MKKSAYPFSSPLATALLLIGCTAFSPLTVSAKDGNRSHNERHTYTEYAEVVAVKPVYRNIRTEHPERHCWTERPSHNTVYEGYQNQRGSNGKQHDRHGNPLLGGLIGGAIGHQLGRAAGGRDAQIGATIAGAVIGSVIGNESTVRDRRDRLSHRERRARNTRDHRKHKRHTPAPAMERCTTRTVTHVEKLIDGYDVTYRFRGRQYTMHSHRHPGNRIALEISVRPARS